MSDGQEYGHEGPRFFRRSRIGAKGALALRALGVLLLIGIALGGHLLDREGLRDNSDGHVSFLDVVYFTVVTVTTVGYGDIVPVTDRARMFDTFVVTPIRIFIFLIFLGSAYSFMLRQGWERFRMRQVRQGVSGHVIVCGYGSTGEASVRELLARGVPLDDIIVVDLNAERLRMAEELGVATVEGDATHNAVLGVAKVADAASIIVAPGRDDTAVLILLTIRSLAATGSIAVRIEKEENERLARDAGADIIVNPIHVGGQLLAGSTVGPHIVDYVSDLITRGGQCELHERLVSEAEIGNSARSIESGQVLRIYRDGCAYGFWETEVQMLVPGDSIIEVVKAGDGDALPAGGLRGEPGGDTRSRRGVERKA